jgi:hypothetical protein
MEKIQISQFKKLAKQFKKLNDNEKGFSYTKIISVLGFDYKVDLQLYTDIVEEYFDINSIVNVTPY